MKINPLYALPKCNGARFPFFDLVSKVQYLNRRNGSAICQMNVAERDVNDLASSVETTTTLAVKNALAELQKLNESQTPLSL